MADFLTRLVERTWGVAPVVKPLITPLFSPENLPDQTAVGFDIEEDSEQMTLTHPQLNSIGKSRIISPEFPTIPKTEQNSQSFLEVEDIEVKNIEFEDEFSTQSNSTEIQTFSRGEAFKQPSKISADQSSSSAIIHPTVNPLLPPNTTRKFSQNSTQDSTQDLTQKFTQKDSPLTQSQNSFDRTVNQSSLRFPQKSTQTPDNYLDSKPKKGLMSSKEATLLPNQNRGDWLENKKVKQVQQRKAFNSNLSQKLSISRSHDTLTQTYQKQQPQKQQKIQAVEQPVPPTIKVKIGRIEVRANTPEPRTKSSVQSPKHPRLSLDEYLRSNSGGKP